MLAAYRYNILREKTAHTWRDEKKIGSPQLRASIWAVGGGKGGVGKSLMTSSFGILLSRLGKKVLLVDADLGAANLHTFVGTEGGMLSISGFLRGTISSIEDLISRTPIPNLELISGAKDPLDAADFNGNGLIRLKEALKKIGYDYILLDIGPGTSSTMLDMFLLSDEGIVITTPEPTSIENTYRFLKCLFMRRIKKALDMQNNAKLKELVQKILNNQRPQQLRTFANIFEEVIQMDFAGGQMLKTVMRDIRLSIIVNQIKKSDDREIGPSMEMSCYHYFGSEIRYLGHITYEDCVVDSIRARKPFTVYYNDSMTAKTIEACMSMLVNKK